MHQGLTDGPELERLAALGWDAGFARTNDEGVRVVDRNVEVDYPTEGLAALGLDGGSGYWFDHRVEVVAAAISATTDVRTIWDVGAGTGGMARRLARAGFEVIAVEPIMAGAAAIARQQCGPVFCGSFAGLGLPPDCLRVVGLFDVIEHLGDPSALLSDIGRALEPGGIVVITVPALPALWSTEDDVAGHHRRYTKGSLDALMRQCGYRAVTAEYIFASLLLPAIALRTIPYRLGRRRSAEHVHSATTRHLAPSTSIDAAARRILRAERAIGRRVPLPVGLSVLGVYKIAKSDATGSGR